MSERVSEKGGSPQGGFKSETGRAAYWRMQHEAAIGALADLIAEHRQLIDALESLGEEWEREDVQELPTGDRTAELADVLTYRCHRRPSVLHANPAATTDPTSGEESA